MQIASAVHTFSPIGKANMHWMPSRNHINKSKPSRSAIVLHFCTYSRYGWWVYALFNIFAVLFSHLCARFFIFYSIHIFPERRGVIFLFLTKCSYTLPLLLQSPFIHNVHSYSWWNIHLWHLSHPPVHTRLYSPTFIIPTQLFRYICTLHIYVSLYVLCVYLSAVE